MHFQSDGYNYLIRLDKGEQLVKNLEKFAAAEDITGAWVSGIGGAFGVELGFYELEKQQYSYRPFDQLMEIASLQGPLAWDGNRPVIHLHGVFSDENMQTYAGHVRELTVGGTCELFVHVWNAEQLKRTHESSVGLKILDL